MILQRKVLWKIDDANIELIADGKSNSNQV